MDFNQLMARMRELDQPTNEGGCGMDAPMAPPMSSPMSMTPPKPDTPTYNEHQSKCSRHGQHRVIDETGHQGESQHG